MKLTSVHWRAIILTAALCGMLGDRGNGQEPMVPIHPFNHFQIAQVPGSPVDQPPTKVENAAQFGTTEKTPAVLPAQATLPVQVPGVPPVTAAESNPTLLMPQSEAKPQPDTAVDPIQSRVQGGFPPELILPPPSEQAVDQANRFIQGTIDPEIPLNLVLGRPKVLQLTQVPKRVYVPDSNVLRTEIVDRVSGKEIAVTGLQQGSTTMILWFDDPNAASGQTTVSYLVRVYADPIMARPVESLAKELNEKFPDSYIELDQIEDRLIVRGQTPDTVEMSQILQVLVGARGVATGLLRANDSAINSRALAVGETFNFQDRIDPLVSEEAAAFRRRAIDPIALAQAGIINQLKVVGEQQVMLKVTVAEVNRSAARSIGLNFSVENDAGFTVFETFAQGATQSANILASLDAGQVELAIEALRTLNLSRTLAEPNLVAMNGQSADFQAGGSFPIPVISSGGNGQNLQGVSFVPFGVQLRFTPFIQDRDVIRLQVDANVSARDESVGTNIGGGGGGIGGGGGGTQVSGLNSRNFSSTVELRSGQTIAVAGLLQSNFGASSERIPLWGDLPIIGTTGGTRRTSGGEQELVILVTPQLVAPVDACEWPALPGTDVHEPTDCEFYIANRLESRRNRDYRASVRTDFDRQIHAEHNCAERYMIGQIGPTDRCCPSVGRRPHAVIPVDPLNQSSLHGYEGRLSDSEEGLGNE